MELTVHDFMEPREVRSHAILDRNQRSLIGDFAAWEKVPRLYVEYLNIGTRNDFTLIKIEPSRENLSLQSLEWYDDSYDKGYQGVGDAVEIPGEDFALVSVQRSSKLILHDLTTGRMRASIDLGGRGGNPDLKFRQRGSEIWASDYDTLVVLEGKEFRVLRSARLQGEADGVKEFIGDYAFTADETLCVVARPFSGDVVGIDPVTMKIERAAKLGRQPLEVMALAQGEVVSRDWKTGDLLRGRLQ